MPCPVRGGGLQAVSRSRRGLAAGLLHQNPAAETRVYTYIHLWSVPAWQPCTPESMASIDIYIYTLVANVLHACSCQAWKNSRPKGLHGHIYTYIDLWSVVWKHVIESAWRRRRISRLKHTETHTDTADIYIYSLVVGACLLCLFSMFLKKGVFIFHGMHVCFWRSKKKKLEPATLRTRDLDGRPVYTCIGARNLENHACPGETEKT